MMISMTKTNLALCFFYIIFDITQGLPYLETGLISWIVDIKGTFIHWMTKAAFSHSAKVEGWKLFGFGCSSTVGGKTGKTMVLSGFSKVERSGGSSGSSNSGCCTVMVVSPSPRRARRAGSTTGLNTKAIAKSWFFKILLESILFANSFGTFLRKALTTCFCPWIRLYLFL